MNEPYPRARQVKSLTRGNGVSPGGPGDGGPSPARTARVRGVAARAVLRAVFFVPMAKTSLFGKGL